MPIYEYKCLECGSHIEKMQKVSDEPLKVCEECGGKLEKQWSLSGFQFKGAGWYVTDYAGKKNRKRLPKHGKSGKNGKNFRQANQPKAPNLHQRKQTKVLRIQKKKPFQKKIRGI